ncbi:ADP-ribosylglycohydrolase family protein [Halomonas koreensis]|uniref:ADP-ribosylglycohydrolase family protein n=1 Tax=Halomonas koreensis TaxID=245385 RepID=A0ABU1G5D3_9GAMM|nr:ADP-ribosylglycohydrolase family protein [Halomonas koreensis]MDR5868157.1 ADP-ribosylglycohydrolase family protein [Halomonas koreensis]
MSSDRLSLIERARGGMLALACGDALANGVEFMPRGGYPAITDLHGKPRGLPVGQWSDDTGLALCLGESLVACQAFDPVDQMRRYRGFYERGEGWPHAVPLIAGNTLARALADFTATGNPYSGPTHALAAGNGGLMRLLPVVLASHRAPERCRQWCRDATRTTHGAGECLEASDLLGRILSALLEGRELAHALGVGADIPWASERIARLAQGAYLDKPLDGIKASGYVVDTLEAALWCVARHDGLEAPLLAAANLGDDCDTVAAVAGQIAGCAHGERAIPGQWRETLIQAERLTDLAEALLVLSASDKEG